MLEAARRATIVGKDCGAIAELTGVDECDCLIKGSNTNNRQYRAEDFFFVGTGGGGDVIDKRWAEEEAFLMTFHAAAAAVNNNLCAVGFRNIDVAGHARSEERRVGKEWGSWRGTHSGLLRAWETTCPRG